LSGYATNGWNRIITIKDNNGKIKSKAILKLLKGVETEQYYLLLENFYGDKFVNDILKVAKIKAKTLKIPLVVLPQYADHLKNSIFSNFKIDVFENLTTQFYKYNSPFEYEDAWQITTWEISSEKLLVKYKIIDCNDLIFAYLPVKTIFIYFNIKFLKNFIKNYDNLDFLNSKYFLISS